MTATSPTLAALLHLEEARVPADRLAVAVDSLPREPLTPARRLLRLAMAEALETVTEKLGEVRLSDAVGEAWGRYRELLEYADPERHPPGSVSIVPLAEHTLELTRAVPMEVLVQGRRVATLPFAAVVKLVFEGAALIIRDGRITGMGTGKCTADGSLRCGEVELWKGPSEEVRLPGRVGFGAGVPIAPWRDGPAPAGDPVAEAPPRPPSIPS